MHDLRALVAIPLAIGAGFIGWAVAQTWNATLTAFALCGLVLVLGIAAHGVGNAAGVALHDRRSGAGSQAPTYHLPTGIADPLTVSRALDLQSRAAHRDRQAALDTWTPGGYQVTRWDNEQDSEDWD